MQSSEGECRVRNGVCSDRSLICRSSADLKDEKEDVNDVDVERERPVDVLLRTDCQLPISNKELGVVN